MTDDDDDTVLVSGVDPNWLIFFATLVGMALLAGVVVVGLLNLRVNHLDDGKTRRVKYEACRSIENEASRVVCINRW